ncbi:MAG TPA: alpha/beta fold hydrolase [Roseiflexaceae bacterium]|nr:alpha/beta fold hydrolase [Roseiflexaceae bacterium]
MPKQLEHLIATPRERRYDTPLLLLHGAWHGAWCWRDAMHDLAGRGFEVHAIGLRGHGRSDPATINLCGLRDYQRDLETAVAAIHPRPVVVGHSMGGYILQLFLSEQQLPGAVLLASVPTGGPGAYMLGALRRDPLNFLLAFGTLDLLGLVGTPQRAREAFFRPDIPPAELALYTTLLGPESARVGLESLLFRPRPERNRSPLLLIAAERDTIFTLDEQHATARAYGAELIIIPEAAHDLMLDPAWPLAADAIEQAVARWTS